MVGHADVLYDVVARTVHTSQSGGASGSVRNSIAYVRSTDHGRTWSTLRDIAVIDYPNTLDRSVAGPFVRLFDEPVGIRAGGPAPAAAVDSRTGTVIVVWTQDKGGPAGIAISQLGLTAKRWSAPHLLNPAGTFACSPGIAVDGRGVVGVTYYTASNPSTPPVSCDYWFALSRDGGARFGPPIHLAGPFDPSNAPKSGGYFLGDYEGLAADRSSFHSLFVVVNGNVSDNRTDVVARRVTP